MAETRNARFIREWADPGRSMRPGQKGNEKEAELDHIPARKIAKCLNFEAVSEPCWTGQGDSNKERLSTRKGKIPRFQA